MSVRSKSNQFTRSEISQSDSGRASCSEVLLGISYMISKADQSMPPNASDQTPCKPNLSICSHLSVKHVAAE